MKVYMLFHDKNKTSKIITEYEHKPELFKKLNAEGYGVFVSVNDFEATPEQMKEANASTKRNIKFLSKINAMFSDLDIAKSTDDLTVEEKNKRKMRLYDALMEKCQPSRLVITANGLQPFWNLKNSNISQEYQQRYTDVCSGIIAWSTEFGSLGDDVKDVTRILRMPGYYHNKGEPFMVEEAFNDDVEYTLEDLERVFAEYIKPTKKVEYKPVDKSKLNSVSRQIENLDIREIFRRAMESIGRSSEFDRSGRIILEGRLTGNHQGKIGDGQFIASSSHEDFSGNRITSTAKILGVSNKEARAWIVEEFNITPQNAKIKESLAEKDTPISYSIEKKNKIFTWGTEGLDRAISPIEEGQLNLITGGTGMGKTTFSFDVAQKNAAIGNKVLYISLEQSKQGMIDRLAREAANVTKIEWANRANVTAFKTMKFKEKFDEIMGLKNLNIYGFNGIVEPTIENIFIVINEAKPDLVFIDNFDDIKKETTSEYTENNKTILELRNFAQKTMIPINLLHHRNQKRSDSGIGAVRGSGKITDTVWTSLKCWREFKGEVDQVFTQQDAAAFFVMHEKDREFGTQNLVKVYWQNGTFNDFYKI